MYSKISRYRAQPSVVTTDAVGRAVQSTQLRLLPAVDGAIRHTIEDADRLDHLAYRYYRQSRHWWHVCDANPDVLAPQALLGKEPWHALRLPVAWEGSPPWSALVRVVEAHPHVAAAQMGDADAPAPTTTLVDGDPIATLTDAALRADLESVETALRTGTAAPMAPGDLLATLRQAVVDAGGTLTDPVVLDATGPVRHRLRDTRRRLYAIRYLESEGLVQVFEPTPHVAWTLVMTHNTHGLPAPDARRFVAAFTDDGQSFEVGAPATVERLGSPIAIPNRPLLRPPS